jgi:hypothetical protein
VTVNEPNRGCVVVTIREGVEFLRLNTTDGPIDIELKPGHSNRAKVAVRAPLAVGVGRERYEADDAD